MLIVASFLEWPCPASFLPVLFPTQRFYCHNLMRLQRGDGDQFFCSRAWPGATLGLISNRGDLWEGRGREARWSPVFSAPGFPMLSFHIFMSGHLPSSLLRIQVSSCLSFSQNLSRSWDIFEFLTMTSAHKNAVLLQFFKLLFNVQ